MSTFSRKRPLFLLATACLFIMLVAACGKKGNPTLRSYEKPDAPSSLTALHRENSIILRWSYPRSQEGFIAEFIVLRSTGTGFEMLSHLEKEKRIFTDKDIKIGSTFRYKIICRNFRGIDSNDSNTVSATPVPPPLPPRNLSYTIKNNAVLLSWEPLNIGERYNVYKADEMGTYGLTALNPAPLSVPEFSDTFSVNKIVHYTVRSLTETDVRNEGAASDELIVNPADLVPPRPENLQAFPAADRIFLSWSEPSESWITGFRVYKRTGSADYVLIGQTQIPTFVDQGPAGMKRDYRVTAVGPEKEGPAAEIQNVIHIPQR